MKKRFFKILLCLSLVIGLSIFSLVYMTSKVKSESSEAGYFVYYGDHYFSDKEEFDDVMSDLPYSSVYIELHLLKDFYAEELDIGSMKFVIYLNGHTLTLDECNVDVESINIYGFGGKIRIIEQDGIAFDIDDISEDSNINDVTFSADGEGQLFYIEDTDDNNLHNLNFNNVNFENINLEEEGPVFYLEHSSGSLHYNFDHCSFVNCSMENDNNGGVFYVNNFSVNDLINFNYTYATHCCGNDGGFLYSNDNDTVIEGNNTTVFSNCKASTDGGVFYFDDGTSISRCQFIGNFADGDGGAIAAYYDFFDQSSKLYINGCHFYYNRCNSNGGSIYIGNGSAETKDCSWFDNYSPNEGLDFFARYNSSVRITDGIIVHNRNMYDLNELDDAISRKVTPISVNIYNRDNYNEKFFDEYSKNKYSGGSGTINDPYIIKTIKDWNFFTVSSLAHEDNTHEGKYYRLDSDLTVCLSFGDFSLDKYFSGNFDGNGHTITYYSLDPYQFRDITTNPPAVYEKYNALFNAVKDGTISNLKTDGFIRGDSYLAGIAGYAENATFNNCENNIKIASFGSYVGGIVAYGTEIVVKNCVNSATINGLSANNMYFGGIAGYVEDEETIFNNNTNNASIETKADYVGGIVGCFDGNMDYSNNYGSVTGIFGVGGIVGNVGSTSNKNSIINTSLNNANINGVSAVGGIVGWLSGTICNVINYGNIFGNQNVGGVIGYYYTEAGRIDLKFLINQGQITATPKEEYNGKKDNICAFSNGNVVEVNTLNIPPYYNDAESIEWYNNYCYTANNSLGSNYYKPIVYNSKNGKIEFNNEIIYLDSTHITSVWSGRTDYLGVVVSGSVNINERVEVKGNVVLILLDNSVLNLANGIHLTAGNTLTVVAQNEVGKYYQFFKKMENIPLDLWNKDYYDLKLTTDTSKVGKIVSNVKFKSYAIIGGNANKNGTIHGEDCGNFNLISGIVELYGSGSTGEYGVECPVCIGGGNGAENKKQGGNGGAGGNIKVYGGKLICRTESKSVAIGGGTGAISVDNPAGFGGDGGSLSVYGGYVEAYSSNDKAIGSGRSGSTLSSQTGFLSRQGDGKAIQLDLCDVTHHISPLDYQDKNYIKIEPHNYKSTYTYDENLVYVHRICTNCGHVHDDKTSFVKTVVNPTCTVDGSITYTYKFNYFDTKSDVYAILSSHSMNVVVTKTDDGLKVVETCGNCDYNKTYTWTFDNYQLTNSINVSGGAYINTGIENNKYITYTGDVTQYIGYKPVNNGWYFTNSIFNGNEKIWLFAERDRQASLGLKTIVNGLVFDSDNHATRGGIQIYYKGALVRYFVPACSKDDLTTGGLYDVVEGKFYANNSSTGYILTGVEAYPEVAPNCLQPGYKTYYKLNGSYYSDFVCQNKINNIDTWLSAGGEGYLAPTGHEYIYSPIATFDYEHQTATLIKTCSHCGNEVVINSSSCVLTKISDATCNRDALYELQASFAGVDGSYISEAFEYVKEENDKSLGHSYDTDKAKIEFINGRCYVTLTCTKCDENELNHYLVYSVPATKVYVTEATCQDATYRYIASFEEQYYSGLIQSDIFTEVNSNNGVHVDSDLDGTCDLCKSEVSPKALIKYANLAFEDNIYILYAVKTYFTSDTPILHLWTKGDGEYLVTDTDHFTLNPSSQNYMINGEEYYIFIYDELSAKQMTDEVYAVVEVEGIKSTVLKYSIIEYAYHMFENSDNEALKEYLKVMLYYGASSQSYFKKETSGELEVYNKNRLANDTFYSVTLNNCTLADGQTSGLFTSKEDIVITSPYGQNTLWTVNGIENSTYGSTLILSGIVDNYVVTASDTAERTITFICDDKIGFVKADNKIVTSFKASLGDEIKVLGNILYINDKAYEFVTYSSDYTIDKWEYGNVSTITDQLFINVSHKIIGTRNVKITCNTLDNCKLYVKGEEQTSFNREIPYNSKFKVNGNVITIGDYVIEAVSEGEREFVSFDGVANNDVLTSDVHIKANFHVYTHNYFTLAINDWSLVTSVTSSDGNIYTKDFSLDIIEMSNLSITKNDTNNSITISYDSKDVTHTYTLSFKEGCTPTITYNAEEFSFGSQEITDEMVLRLQLADTREAKIILESLYVL